jgi:hypothetical protein
MSEAIKPTPGPWEVRGIGGPWEQRLPIRAPNWGVVAHVGVDPGLPHWDGPQRANARLIAEAGTVHHETGLTPRQLVERVKELEKALNGLLQEVDLAGLGTAKDFGWPRVTSAARAALPKSLPNT